MNSVLRKNRLVRLAIVAWLALMMGASAPVATFAQAASVDDQKQSASGTQGKDGSSDSNGSKKDNTESNSGVVDLSALARSLKFGTQERADSVAEEEKDTGVVQQTTPPQQQQSQNLITQPLALSPEVSARRVGVDENLRHVMTLQEAIALALRNNLDIEMSRYGVDIAQQSLFAARGAYDLFTRADVNYSRATQATSRVFEGGGQDITFSDIVYTHNFLASQQIEKTAGEFRATFNNSRSDSTGASANFAPEYRSSLALSYLQPVSRNFSLDARRRTIQLAKRALDRSDSAFRQQVIQIISNVQTAYWDLVFAIRNEKITREAVELARVQLENNRKQVEAGTMAPIDLRSTEAALESRKGDVILALQQITIAENRLKGFLLNEPNDRLWNSAIDAADEPQFGQSTYNLEEAIRLALKNRPELEQMKLQLEEKNIDIKFFESQTKPQVDLVATLTNAGLAGSPVTRTNPDGTPRDDGVPERFRGGYFQALSNLFSNDFYTLVGGVTISFPWGNRAAKGDLGAALAQARQLDAQYRQTIQAIQIEVRNALQAVEAARQRFEAQRANRLASHAQLQGEIERFRAGLQTNFFVLERQTEFSQAQGNELRALTDYNKALAELQRVTGLTLVSNNVEIPRPRDNKPAKNGSGTTTKK